MKRLDRLLMRFNRNREIYLPHFSGMSLSFGNFPTTDVFPAISQQLYLNNNKTKT